MNFDPTDESKRPSDATTPACLVTHSVLADGIVTEIAPESIPVGAARLIALIPRFHVPALSPVNVIELFVTVVGSTGTGAPVDGTRVA